MKVFVTGGTGAIGREAVQALVAAGHAVSALARSDEKARCLSDQGAKPVHASLFDEDGLSVAFEGHHAVVNLASALPTTTQFAVPSAWRRNRRVRVEGSLAVTNAAITAGVGLLVQESVVMIYPDRGASWIDEDTPPDRFSIAEANLAAERNAARFTEAGGVGVVLRFGWFYGPGARHSEEFFALARRGMCVSMGPHDSYVSSIHVADGGRAVAAALSAPAGIYNVVDDRPLTKRQYADALARASGAPFRLRAPGRAARLLGDTTLGLRRSLRVSNRRFRDATGWSPRHRSADEGWLAAAATLRASHR